MARIGDRDRHAQRDGQVVHPAGNVAGLNAQQRARRIGRLVRDEQVVDRGGRGLHGVELISVRGRVVNAQHAVELAEIQRENSTWSPSRLPCGHAPPARRWS